MKKFLLLTAIVLSSVLSSVTVRAQVNIPYQEIRYDVHYHWGLVNVQIAQANVTIEAGDSREFSATMNGHSIPWEGRVLCVSDTLRATMSETGGVSREKISYINGWYRKPKTAEYRSTGYNPNNPVSYKNILGGGELDASGSTMEAIDVTANMLGLFYTFHELDMERMNPGQSVTIPIETMGSGSDRVEITYKGKSDMTIDGVSYPVYDVVFEYSYRGTMSGYPVTCRVGCNDRIPLYFAASLPVGHVEMIYNP